MFLDSTAVEVFVTSPKHFLSVLCLSSIFVESDRIVANTSSERVVGSLGPPFLFLVDVEDEESHVRRSD